MQNSLVGLYASKIATYRDRLMRRGKNSANHGRWFIGEYMTKVPEYRR